MQEKSNKNKIIEGRWWIIENKIREEVRKQIVEFSHENCPAQKRWLGTDKEDTDY